MKANKRNSEKKRTSISQDLAQVVKGGIKITYRDLVDRLGNHAFGIIIILFALPSILPLSVIPGFSLIFGLPIFFVAAHLIIGKQSLWLPQFLATKEINLKRLEQIITKTIPYLKQVERISKPRWCFLTSDGMERLHGLLLLILSMFMALPIPFSNMILALLIILLGLGLAERDGLMITVVYLTTFVLVFLFTQLTQVILGLF
ncbi:MAG: exopolysaccharide biosynthesis protein [Tatlockia sp.]|nr:exopolysaccharide biosynthesis protein [Tatlockia sp.]